VCVCVRVCVCEIFTSHLGVHDFKKFENSLSHCYLFQTSDGKNPQKTGSSLNEWTTVKL